MYKVLDNENDYLETNWGSKAFFDVLRASGKPQIPLTAFLIIMYMFVSAIEALVANLGVSIGITKIINRVIVM